MPVGVNVDFMGTRVPDRPVPLWHRWEFWLVVLILGLSICILGYSLLYVHEWSNRPQVWLIVFLAFVLAYLLLDGLLNIALLEFVQSRSRFVGIALLSLLVVVCVTLFWLWWRDVGAFSA